MVYGVVIEVLRLQGARGDANDSQSISHVASQLAQDAKGKSETRRAGYDLLASAAAFRDQIEALQQSETRQLLMRDHQYGYESWKFRDDGFKTQATMAIRTHSDRSLSICFIVRALA